MMYKFFAALLALVIFMGVSITPAQARHNDDYYYYNNRQSTMSPYVKKALIGAGIGALASGALSRDGFSSGSIIRGALIGGGAGVGYQYLRNRGYLGGQRRDVRYRPISNGRDCDRVQYVPVGYGRDPYYY